MHVMCSVLAEVPKPADCRVLVTAFQGAIAGPFIETEAHSARCISHWSNTTFAKQLCESDDCAEQEAQEGREEAQARARELLAETQRLEAHVSDLETRKRAPLYQKKQEDELRAAVEKAAEAELRATDAELKYKEAKVRHCLAW